MISNDAKEIAKSVDELRRALLKMDQTVQAAARKFSMSLHPTTFKEIDKDHVPEVLLADIPLRIDWTDPPIKGGARIVKTITGFIDIQIHIPTDDDAGGARIENLIKSLPLEGLLISAIDPARAWA